MKDEKDTPQLDVVETLKKPEKTEVKTVTKADQDAEFKPGEGAEIKPNKPENPPPEKDAPMSSQEHSRRYNPNHAKEKAESDARDAKLKKE